MKATKRRFNKLRQKLWRNPEIMNELFSDEEWSQHKGKVDQEKTNQMFNYVSEKVVKQSVFQERKRTVVRRLQTTARYAVAASVFLLAGWIILKWSPYPAEHTQVKLAATHKIIQKPVLWHFVTNTGHKIKSVHLPDSSVVKLYPRGIVKYEGDFSKTLRNVYLTGKAYFKVKRNPQRPFTVYAGGLKTTALGTSFTINTVAGKLQTSVRLHTGKIVVKPEDLKSRQKPVYLSKAESGLIFDREQQSASLIQQPDAIKVKLTVSLVREGNTIMMKNIPLKKVFKMLAESYNVKILSDDSINNITYTGEVNTDKENIESVLNVICLINNMSLSRGPDQEYILQTSNK